MTSLLLALAALGADSSWIDRQTDPALFTLLGTHRAAWPWKMSPAGDAVVLFDGRKVRVGGVTEGAPVRTLGEHRGDVHDSGWSLDGRVLATTGENGNVCAWDVRTGRLLARLAGPHPGFT